MHVSLKTNGLLVVLFLHISVCLAFSRCAYSQTKDAEFQPVEIVITASRIEQPRDQVASSISIIDAETIESQQDYSLVDALKSQPSLDIVSTGTKGSSTSVSIRGANPEHTLVLLDGVEINNPILPSRSFNFADLMLNEVDRIEILRGPQSTIYGSDAMGGVVNVISKKGQGPLVLKSSIEAGSNSNFTELASASAGEEQYNYVLSILRQDVDGISAADSRSGNLENDAYANTSYMTRFGISPTSDTEVNTIFHAIDSNSELDNMGGVLGDDLNRTQENAQYFWGSSLSSRFLEDDLKSSVSYALSDQSFIDNNDPDALSNEFLRSKYQGQLSTVHGQIDYKLNENIALISGAETQEETGESRYLSDGAYGPYENQFSQRSSSINGYFAQTNFTFIDQLYLNTGIRVDDHTKFGSETTWRIAPAWLLRESGARIFSTIGKGFKAPSLFQLYSNYGSPELSPERTMAVDVGIEKNILGDLLKVNLSYFHQKFDDLIDFDPNTFIFSNINSATTSGVESGVSATICEWASLDIGYTYLDASNNDNGAALLRRAKNKMSANLRLNPSDSWDLGIQTNYRSSRFDNDFSSIPAKTDVLAGYATLDLLGRYRIEKQMELFARIENLFDRNYSEVVGYGSYGIAGFVGMRIQY